MNSTTTHRRRGRQALQRRPISTRNRARCDSSASFAPNALARRMGWKFPWASSFNSDFNNDFSVSFTEKRQREVGVEHNYRREAVFEWRAGQEGGGEGAEAKFAAMCGTDAATYHRDRPGMSVRARGRRRLPHLFHLCARGGRNLGHVRMARPRPQGSQRDGRLVAPPRRVRHAPSDVVAQLRNGDPKAPSTRVQGVWNVLHGI